MEQQINNQFVGQPAPQLPKSKTIKPFLVVILLVLVLALVGVLVWQRNITNQIADSLQQQISGLQNQINKKIIATTSNETAGWKTYAYGFSIKYPSDWRFVEYPGTGQIGFGKNPVPEGSEGPNDFQISISNDSVPLSFSRKEEYLTDIVQSTKIIDGEASFFVEGKLYGFLGGPGEEEEGNTYIYGYFIKKGITYSFSAHLGKPYDPAKKIIFEKILSTFKFTK